ncbi:MULTISPECIES: hypothetical protein [Dickeya]|uniref:hypothetical protein n=1 Tax=Dickeya TaxID=204037 RepID=UPI0014401803|nr:MULTISPECIES: hypothetical protein [Dickeya]MBP2850965.1 hypothetical protein [Dickeya oryzae]MCO7252902.1 hypothetical protein [Dickeya oryzae]QIZ46533.1 hypothetical protein DWV07_06325 [Dickeya zeae]QYM96696.1 hypothetical protein FGI04_12400 [Dickeya zeae]UPT56713.1 hypothetical protein FGI00_14695 [Dickeya zeae]
MRVNPFTASWSRNGNLLCHGHWIIRYLEREFELPEKYHDQHLGTLGIYSVIDPDDELYRDGLDEDDWILENVDWLADCFEQHQVPIEEDYFRFFYQAVNPHDWRCTSCAGCM